MLGDIHSAYLDMWSRGYPHAVHHSQVHDASGAWAFYGLIQWPSGTKPMGPTGGSSHSTQHFPLEASLTVFSA